MVQALSEVQEVHFQEPTLLLVQHIEGEADIAEVTKHSGTLSLHSTS